MFKINFHCCVIKVYFSLLFLVLLYNLSLIILISENLDNAMCPGRDMLTKIRNPTRYDAIVIIKCTHLADRRRISVSRPWTQARVVCIDTYSYRCATIPLTFRSIVCSLCCRPMTGNRVLPIRCRRPATPYRCSLQHKFPSNISRL